MPLLTPEPALHPGSLFDTPRPEELQKRVWWVMHTRPRQEKSLARELYTREIPFYLPLIHKRWRVRGRLMNSYVPLFASYLFVLGEQKERITVLSTNRVVQALAVVNQDQLWSDLHQVYRLIASGAPITPEEKLQPGTAVEIKGGVLAGLRGVIVAAASGKRFVVRVDFIQRGASILLDDINLARVD